jgi:PAS domain-containing protein
MNQVLNRWDRAFREALDTFQHGRDRFHAVLEAIAAPIYVTDAEGWVTFATKACVGFTGRRPAVGKDRWCVTWKLFTEDGQPLPHDQCPMAVAIGEKREIRGLTAVAERPGGERVTFMPFPTPLFDEHGRFSGAVNMLIDVSEVRQVAELRKEAERCRWLASGVDDARTAETLKAMAAEYLAKAGELEQRQAGPASAGVSA